mgnify:CR=1 FL=1
MKNNQKIPVSILADREVFEYLKEKGDERKTRTEATVICWTNHWQVSFLRF